jgi:hypothetical protein
MASVAPYRRIGVEDINLDDPAQAVEQLLYPINLNFETLSNALQKDITFNENISATTRQLTFTTDGSSAISNIRIAHRLPRSATHLLITQLYETTNRLATTFSSGPFPSWYDDGAGNVVITAITGLAANTSYTITVLVA